MNDRMTKGSDQLLIPKLKRNMRLQSHTMTVLAVINIYDRQSLKFPQWNFYV